MMRIALICALLLPAPLLAIDAGGRVNHGEQVTVDLPDELHRRNTTSLGQGCCTWTSLHHAALYQNVPAFWEAPKWIQEHRIAGGASPNEWSRYLPQMAKERGYPVPDFVQHTGGDVEFLKLGLRTGRYMCVTYDGHDGVFYNGYISHMVNLVHLSDQWAVIHDNNNPKQYLWMIPEQFLTRWRGGGGWAVALLAPPPPPIPTTKNAEANMNALLMATLLTGPGSWGPLPCAPVRSASTPAPTNGYHGWYQSKGARTVELWWRGELVGVLNPATGYWQTNGKEHWLPLQSLAATGEATPFRSTSSDRPTQDERQRVGQAVLELFKTGKPSPQCICEKDACKCKTCPEGCVATQLTSAPGCLCPHDACECQNCPQDCPQAQPNGPRPLAQDPCPGGVRRDLFEQGNRYYCNSRACSRSEAFQRLSEASLVDDTGKAFLTIVGDEAMRKQVLADIDSSSALREFKGKLHVNAYAPDDWHVKQIGLQPGITYQTALKDQEHNVVPVEFRFRAYAGDAALAEAIRKVDPKYQPDKDPDPTKKPINNPDGTKINPTPATLPTLPNHLLVTLGALTGLVGAAYLWGRHKKTV